MPMTLLLTAAMVFACGQDSDLMAVKLLEIWGSHGRRALEADMGHGRRAFGALSRR
jgi:hypothetical protein